MKMFVFKVVGLTAVMSLALAIMPAMAAKSTCATIQGGTLTDVAGNAIGLGYDQWGYNYQARMFNGWYGNYSRPAVPVTGGDSLEMKWNDAWLSNKDCDGDKKLDRHFGFASYIGSGAWLTNHMSGNYDGVDGKICSWNYFVKIVAAPADATKTDGVWFAADGTRIGADIWGEFALTQELYHDNCDKAASYNFHERFPGLGNW